MRLIALSLMPYDEEDDQHRRVAEEVSRLYTGTAFGRGCLRRLPSYAYWILATGKDMASFSGRDHRWMELGFDGTADVPTVKSGGLLTLWMMLYLHSKDKEIALSIFRQSTMPGTQFRFAALCDMVTGWVLMAIKKGKLNALVEDMDTSDFNNLQCHKRRTFEEVSKKLFVGFVYKYTHFSIC